MVTDLKNKVVVVTGGAEGIGSAISEAFLQNGAKVLILDVNENLGATVVKKFNVKYENRAAFWKCDVTKDLDEISKRVIETYKTVDVLVNNAGVLDEFNVQRMMNINVIATIEWTRKFYEHMRKDKGGKGGLIINMGSINGFRMNEWLGAYKASKYAVMAFTRSAGDKFHFNRSGVRIAALCPGYTDTKMGYGVVASKDPEVQALWNEDQKNVTYFQPTESVGKAAIEFYEKAESGSCWLIEDDKFSLIHY